MCCQPHTAHAFVSPILALHSLLPALFLIDQAEFVMLCLLQPAPPPTPVCVKHVESTKAIDDMNYLSLCLLFL